MAEFNIGNPSSLFSIENSEFMSRYPELAQDNPRPKRCVTKHTPAEWEAIRDEFSGLYSSGFNLPELIRYFQRLGFDATERQYKRKIEAWALTGKNIKSSEKEFMVRKEAQRLELGKQTTFWINGRLVEERKLKDARKKMLSETWIARSAGKTPSNITYQTPQENTQITYHRASIQQDNTQITYHRPSIQQEKVPTLSKSNSTIQGIPVVSQKALALQSPIYQDVSAINRLRLLNHGMVFYHCCLCHTPVDTAWKWGWDSFRGFSNFARHINNSHGNFNILVIQRKYSEGYGYLNRPRYWWPGSPSHPFPARSSTCIGPSLDSGWTGHIYGRLKNDNQGNIILGHPLSERSSAIRIETADHERLIDSAPHNQDGHRFWARFGMPSDSVPSNNDNTVSPLEVRLEESNFTTPDTIDLIDLEPFGDTELDWLLSFPYESSNIEDSTQTNASSASVGLQDSDSD